MDNKNVGKKTATTKKTTASAVTESEAKTKKTATKVEAKSIVDAAKTEAPKPKKKPSFVVPITLKSIGIDEKITPAKKECFALDVRVIYNNSKQRTADCKGRSEVLRTGKKPWRQKGTGRARAGTARSPLWRGGGVIFGPRPGVKNLKVTKKVKRRSLRSLLLNYCENKDIAILKWELKGDKPSTAQAYSFLKQEQLLEKNLSIFFALDDLKTQLSFVNIPNVLPTSFDQPDSYRLSKSHKWLIFEKDIDLFKEMVEQWI